MKYIIITFTLIVSTGCMSLQTRHKLVEEQVMMHPEFIQIQQQIDRLEAKYDTLLAKMNTVEEAHRDDTEMVLVEMRKMIVELTAQLKKP